MGTVIDALGKAHRAELDDQWETYHALIEHIGGKMTDEQKAKTQKTAPKAKSTSPAVSISSTSAASSTPTNSSSSSKAENKLNL